MRIESHALYIWMPPALANQGSDDQVTPPLCGPARGFVIHASATSALCSFDSLPLEIVGCPEQKDMPQLQEFCTGLDGGNLLLGGFAALLAVITH